MIEVDSKTFKSGNSEAIRLPKEVAFGAGVPVTIRRIGSVLTISPKQRSMADLVNRLRQIGAPSDGVQEIEKISFPEADGR